MINRRDVIASGLAVSFFARASAASLTGAASAPGLSVPLFVADERYPESRMAARAAERGGVAIRALGEDVTAVYESLDLAWRSAPFAIAGMTTANALFVIERLAWEHGLRTLYRGIHRRAADRRFRHELLGAPTLIRRMGLETTPDWPVILGSALAESVPCTVDRRRIITSQALPDPDGATLTSWLLAPKRDIVDATAKRLSG